MSRISGSLIRKGNRRGDIDWSQLSDSDSNLSVATLEQVTDKLETYYKNIGDERHRHDLRTEAENLIDPQKVKEKHLNSLLTTQDPANLGSSQSYEHTMEYNMAVRRVESFWTNATNLPIKLYLTEIDHVLSNSILGRYIAGGAARLLLNTVYGPLHAALQVGDVFIEWDDSSLVIPMTIPDSVEEVEQDTGRRIKFVAPVHHGGSFYGAAQQHKREVRQTIGRSDSRPNGDMKIHFTRQVELFSTIGEHRERIVNQLARVIANYNSRNYYDVFSRNCQHFVQDCLKALEVEEPSRPKFPQKVQEQFKQLKRGQTISARLGRRRFKTHNEVDEYYEANKDNLSKDDLQYILLLYCKFHLRAMKADLAEGEVEHSYEWECTMMSCRQKQVEMRLEELSATELGFRPTETQL